MILEEARPCSRYLASSYEYILESVLGVYLEALHSGVILKKENIAALQFWPSPEKNLEKR